MKLFGCHPEEMNACHITHLTIKIGKQSARVITYP